MYINKLKQFPLSSKLFLFFISLLFNLTQGFTQQIDYDTIWNQSHKDYFIYNDMKFNNYSVTSGLTYKDSILYDTNNIFSLLFQRQLSTTNVLNKERLDVLYNPKDSLYFTIDTIPINLISSKEWILKNYFKNTIIITEWNNLINSLIYRDIFVMSLDSNGTPQWFTYLNLYPLSDVKGKLSTFVSPAGDIFITGIYTFSSAPTGTDIFTAKVDKDGTLLWNKRYYIDNMQNPFHTTLLTDGSYLISGTDNNKAMFFKIDPLTGDSLRLYNSLTIPMANLSNLEVKYVEELPNHTYLSMVKDGSNQGYICYLDSNFNLLSSHLTNSNFNTFFKVNDNYYIGYNSYPGYNAIPPPLLFGFDSVGTELWKLTLTTPQYVNFTPDGNGGLMGAGAAPGLGAGNQSDFYLCRIDSVGYPAPPICHNPPSIQSIQQDFGTNLSEIILSNTSNENIKYSNVLVSNWYFQDGTTLFGDTIYKTITAACPTSFWAMCVITDGVGCTDTLTIDVCTGQILPNPEWPIRDTTVAIAEKNYKGVVIKRPKIYPNPTTGKFTVELNSFLVHGFLVKVYDIFGKNIQTLTPTNTNTVINLSQQANGIYIIEITTDEYIYREKVVKE